MSRNMYVSKIVDDEETLSLSLSLLFHHLDLLPTLIDRARSTDMYVWMKQIFGLKYKTCSFLSAGASGGQWGLAP